MPGVRGLEAPELALNRQPADRLDLSSDGCLLGPISSLTVLVVVVVVVVVLLQLVAPFADADCWFAVVVEIDNMPASKPLAPAATFICLPSCC